MKVYHLVIPIAVVACFSPKAATWIVAIGFIVLMSLVIMGVLVSPLVPKEKAKKED